MHSVFSCRQPRLLFSSLQLLLLCNRQTALKSSAFRDVTLLLCKSIFAMDRCFQTLPWIYRTARSAYPGQVKVHKTTVFLHCGDSLSYSSPLCMQLLLRNRKTSLQSSAFRQETIRFCKSIFAMDRYIRILSWSYRRATTRSPLEGFVSSAQD